MLIGLAIVSVNKILKNYFQFQMISRIISGYDIVSS